MIASSTCALGDILEEFDERLGKRNEPEVLTLTEKHGFIAQRERFNKRLAVADTSNYKLIGLHDVAFNPYLLWAGAIAQNTNWPSGIISPLYPTFHVRNGHDPRFVNYMLHSHDLVARYDGISFGSVPRKRRASVADFLSLSIPEPPPYPEQRRIAEILNRAETLRAKRRAALAQLDTLTQSIFMDLFGDPRANSKRWPVRTLRDLTVEFHYGTSNKSNSHGYPTLRIPNIIGGDINLCDMKFVPVEKAEFERLKLIDGDVLFVRTNGNPDNVGRCAVFSNSLAQNHRPWEGSLIYASYLIRARIKQDKIHPVFLREFMLGVEGRRQLRVGSKTSAGQFNINTETLGAIKIPCPPLSLQVSFARRVGDVEKLRATVLASREKMNSLFGVLQHRAFRGDL